MKKFTLRLFVTLLVGVAWALSVPRVMAQSNLGKNLEIKISGKVIDENAVGIAGVSITLKGTTQGTTTDA